MTECAWEKQRYATRYFSEAKSVIALFVRLLRRRKAFSNPPQGGFFYSGLNKCMSDFSPKQVHPALRFHNRSADGVKRNPGLSPRIPLRCIRATALRLLNFRFRLPVQPITQQTREIAIFRLIASRCLGEGRFYPASQSCGFRNTSYSSASGVPASGCQS